MNRAENLNRIRSRDEPWDLIIIGGGATGVGCAVDAASRGLDVVLLEQHDFGKGTSSRSTKLIHGGVRYLGQGNISLVREALRERAILLANAPHVVHKQAFIVPCYSLWQKIFYGAGLKIYDLMAGKYSPGKSQILSRSETLKRLSGIRRDALVGGVLYYDGQFDDTRLLIDLLRTANSLGAAVLNYAPVRTLIKDSAGNIDGVEFEDIENREKLSVQAKAVINATGAFCDAVREMSDAVAEPLVTLSQGVHLVFDRSFLPGDAALMIPKTSDGRVLFCIPWHGVTLVGTTDTPIPKTNLEPQALESEINFILETASGYLTKKPTRDDIQSIFAGIRPLVRSSASKNTASLSRGHTIEIDSSNLLTITGGKWTTYRRMAEDAVDQAIKLGGFEYRASRTNELKIEGPQDVSETGRLHPDLPYSEADIIRAVRDEMAITVEDVLARRTRYLFLNAKAAVDIAPAVARIMAAELEKDDEWIDAEVTAFTQLAEKYRATNSGISEK